jgi:hypothetical protein
MKKIKLLLTAGFLALGIVSTASAATTLKITGSTAFRKALYAAIINKLGNGTVKVAYVASASGLGSANQATFVSSDGNTIVQCCMAGSVGGVHWNGHNPPINPATAIDGSGNPVGSNVAWISAATVASSGATASTSGDPAVIAGGAYLGTQSGVATSTWDPAAPANVDMSDSYQDSTPYSEFAAGMDALTEGNSGNLPGVVAFTWAKSLDYANVDSAAPGGYGRFTNMTPLGFQNLEAEGIAPLSIFTGVASDSAVDVVLTGRDFDSGTRLCTMAESFGSPVLGPVDTAAVQYFGLNASNGDVGLTGTGPTTHLQAFATETEGYSSGGSVKNLLLASIASGSVDANGKPFILVAYLGLSDNPSTAQDLTHDGYAYSPAAIEAGQYTYWTYEHMYYDLATAGRISSAQQGVADSIDALMNSTYADVSGVNINSMNCDRFGPEGTVVNNR